MFFIAQRRRGEAVCLIADDHMYFMNQSGRVFHCYGHMSFVTQRRRGDAVCLIADDHMYSTSWIRVAVCFTATGHMSFITQIRRGEAVCLIAEDDLSFTTQREPRMVVCLTDSGHMFFIIPRRVGGLSYLMLMNILYGMFFIFQRRQRKAVCLIAEDDMSFTYSERT